MFGEVHSIETFGTVDGPGVRFVLFLQGCPMRCAFCHNPDTWEVGGGTKKNASEIVSEVLKYERYLKNGGVTVSGGEPLMQIDFLIELFALLKEKGFHTCIDTSGCVYEPKNNIQKEKLKKLFFLTDLVLLDIKHIDDKKHISLTGKSNKNILKFAKFLDKQKTKIWLRYVLLPTINSDEKCLIKWKQFASGLKNVEKIEVLPYHKMGIEKYKKLNIPYRLEKLQIPTKEEIYLAEKILNA